jgi:signal transduction histidine kinase
MLGERGEVDPMMVTPRVLLVDDEPSVLETMAAILSQEGYDVVEASTVDEALRQLRQHDFDLLLTDLRIDNGSGLTLLAEVRQHAPDTTAIMLTGYASLESAIDALREGAYDYLVKPCHVEELKATVARGVERSQLARALRDRIEELDQANAQLRTFSDELQERIAQATADLRQKVDELADTNHQLADANHRLEEASRLREEFISMAAHELKTPVTSLRATAQLLLRRLDREGFPSAEELARRMTLIDQQSDKLTRLVSQMLDLTRLEGGRLPLAVEEIDLAALVRDIVESEQLKTSQHDIVLKAPDRLMTWLDPLRIDQALTNLIDNAIKYSPEGGEITVELGQPKAEAIELAVTDHGMGIAPEHRAHIFERFYRAHDNRHLAGIGLGLYITHQIVELHGGEIRAEFPAAGGTRFVLHLPVTQEAAGRAPTPARSS